jgi:hypothetical protein
LRAIKGEKRIKVRTNPTATGDQYLGEIPPSTRFSYNFRVSLSLLGDQFHVLIEFGLQLLR